MQQEIKENKMLKEELYIRRSELVSLNTAAIRLNNISPRISQNLKDLLEKLKPYEVCDK